MIELRFDPKKGIWAEKEDADRLRNNSFGEQKGDKLWLTPEEALYVVDLQNGQVRYGKKSLGFSDLLAEFARKEPRLMVKYNAYRDWRDRGLIIKRSFGSSKGNKRASHVKKYPAKEMKMPKAGARLVWDRTSAMGVIEDPEVSGRLFSDWWLGQVGVYKQERGSILKLNFFETVLLAEHFGLKVLDAETGKTITAKKIMDGVAEKREFAKTMYQAYEDWRLNGYIVKTGFKFGTHFRIYFPGASPTKGGSGDKWVHSKHVLHVFPKEEKLLISEWARAVRVAHGVKKTFILGMPKLTRKDYVDYPADFVAYRRKKVGKDWIRETPKDGARYLLAAVSEEEHIGGQELASLLKKAELMNLNLILSITDRETAITYYALNKINLKGAKYDYYEIEWMRP
ncbi:MAG: tRNA-intron lyase [Candidatus Aenigmatarchaeota archaeon]|nr:MAG: tRNA-intron lyase [Candidatus Aenigmarchaeota archaeon]